MSGERRAKGVNRVVLQTRVELCGLDPSEAGAFEAESINVSGRGLHARTGYVPKVGTSLVCRFYDRGREIVAEGTVAWNRPDQTDGEFGLTFTALDSNSVDALRALTGLAQGEGDDVEDDVEDDEPVPEPARPARARTSDVVSSAPPVAPLGPPPTPNDPGARVRLHIEGLGAPMKAQVRRGSRSRVRVGSKLEFLKVGRRLEIENLERGGRRQACIDGVEIVLDPQSGTPQLVVALHYADLADITPEPTVIDDEPASSDVGKEPAACDREPPPRAAATGTDASSARASGAAPQETASPHAGRVEAKSAGETSAGDAGADYEGLDEYDYSDPPPEEEVLREAAAFQSKLGVVAGRASDLAQHAGSVFAQIGQSAVRGVGRMGTGLRSLRKKEAAQKPRRTTAPPPQGALSSEGRRLRPQRSPVDAAQGATTANQRRAAEAKEPGSGAGKSVLRSRLVRRAGLGTGLLLTAGGLAYYAINQRAIVEVAGPQVASSAAEPVAAEPVAAATLPQEVAAAPSNRAPRKLTDAPQRTKDGITANVPLFGPTPMATMEPAPLGPPPGTADDDEAAPPVSKSQAVDDEAFDDKIVSGTKSWGKGRLNLPTMYRIRLDGAGKVFKGSVNATGFSVVVPDRKVMEGGKAIAGRDPRIVRVSTDNGADGARITFRFRDEVPPYRVRLLNDYVEFAVSAAE